MTLRYWDSCVMLGFLREEADKLQQCQEVIGEAQAGKLTIVTSTFAIAEVLWVKGKGKIPVEDRKKVRDFFRNEWIAVREVDRKVAHLAQDVVWDHGVKPKDAIHVATALDADVECLDTYDEPLLALSGQVGNPGLVICKPGASGTLFEGTIQNGE